MFSNLAKIAVVVHVQGRNQSWTCPSNLILNMAMTKGTTSYNYHPVPHRSRFQRWLMTTHVCGRLRSQYTIEPPTLSIYLTRLSNRTRGDVEAASSARDTIKDEKILGKLRGQRNRVIPLLEEPHLRPGYTTTKRNANKLRAYKRRQQRRSKGSIGYGGSDLSEFHVLRTSASVFSMFLLVFSNAGRFLLKRSRRENISLWSQVVNKLWSKRDLPLWGQHLDEEGSKWKALFIKVRLPTARCKQRYWDMEKWTYNVKGVDM